MEQVGQAQALQRPRKGRQGGDDHGIPGDGDEHEAGQRAKQAAQCIAQMVHGTPGVQRIMREG